MPNFWVEGETDKCFLDYYLTEQLQQDKYKIYTLNGYSKIIKSGSTFEIPEKPVFLLDGDIKGKKDYKKIKSFFDKNPSYKTFYIEPDLETFLLETKSCDAYIDCFKAYEECIEKDLSSKSRLYAYWEACGLEFKKDKRKGCWEIFDFDSSTFSGLETFLKKCFE